MPLSVDMLTAHGFTPRTVAVWSRQLGKQLLPLQEKAIREFGFLHGRDLVVFAPTASGKTFVGEVAALRQIEQGRAVAFLVPTRALAEEKTREFTERYRDLRLRILCSTRERPENDRRVAEGRFDWLVAVYEKFSAHLVSHPNLLGRLGLIVADELQMLGDRERGPALDVLLTKVRLSPCQVQRIALSAVLSDALRIANWLEADLLHFDKRPVDLLEGVVDVETGLFHWRSFNAGVQGIDPLGVVFDPSFQLREMESDSGVGGKPSKGGTAERFLGSPVLPEAHDEFRRDAVIALARWVAEERGEQALVFVPTRWMSRAWAEESAFHSRLDPARDALESLERHEPNRGRDLLAACLRAGIGFHNADLPAALRRLVERQFQAGEIRLLFSTPTLAQGVNLAGRNVIQVPHMVGEDPWTRQASVLHLSRERFRNQGGRAARTGRTKGIGRSILLAAGEAEVERLRRLLVEGDLDEIQPPLDGADLTPALLDLLVGGAANSVEDLVQFLLETFTGQTVWSAARSDVGSRVRDALRRLETARLVRLLGDGERIEVGGLAQAVAAAGIFPETAALLIHWLDQRRAARHDPLVLEPIFAAALGKEMRPVFPPLVGREHSEPIVFEELHRRLDPERRAGARMLWSLLARPTGFTADDRRVAKLALLLHDWIGTEDTESIEMRYGVLSGSIASAGAQAAWIVRTAASLAAALGVSDVPDALRRVADRLEPGVGDEGVELARLRVEGLGRGAIGALLRDGIRAPEDIHAWPQDRLRAILPGDVCEALLETIAVTGKEEQAGPAVDEERQARRRAGKKQTRKADRSNKSYVAHQSDESDQTDRSDRSESVREPEPSTAEPSSQESSSPENQSRDVADVLKDPVLVIDSQSPGMVEWGGRSIRLPNLPFRLLVTLAKKPGRGVTYRELVDRMWQGQAVVEQQQVNYHRMRVTKALAGVMGDEEARALITTNAGQGMVLNLPPERVRILE